MDHNRVVDTTTLGRTGLTVTPVGLGLAALGRPAYINFHRDRDIGSRRTVGEMERRCHSVLDAAWGAGIHYFDAARFFPVPRGALLCRGFPTDSRETRQTQGNNPRRL
jgi:aryl-alcohol dehydrogenase-like predicted oxidoreductase